MYNTLISNLILINISVNFQYKNVDILNIFHVQFTLILYLVSI